VKVTDPLGLTTYSPSTVTTVLSLQFGGVCVDEQSLTLVIENVGTPNAMLPLGSTDGTPGVSLTHGSKVIGTPTGPYLVSSVASGAGGAITVGVIVELARCPLLSVTE
jgi:hypothetical protein